MAPKIFLSLYNDYLISILSRTDIEYVWTWNLIEEINHIELTNFMSSNFMTLVVILWHFY